MLFGDNNLQLHNFKDKIEDNNSVWNNSVKWGLVYLFPEKGHTI